MTYPPPPPRARRSNRTAWIAGGVAGTVVLAIVIIVGVVRLAGPSGGTYASRADLCERLDASPVFDIFPMAEADHSGEANGDVGRQGCEFRLRTQSPSVSTLRLTLEVWPTTSEAKHRHEESVEFQATSELVPHDPFHTVEEATGPWQQGMIYVGDVFRSADYNVRLKVHDGNLTLQIDLIIDGADAPTTYGTEEDLPVAVRRVAANTLDALAR